jgi:hypothetical protein
MLFFYLFNSLTASSTFPFLTKTVRAIKYWWRKPILFGVKLLAHNLTYTDFCTVCLGIIYDLWPRAECGVFALQSLKCTDVCSLCVALCRTCGRGWETLKATHFWKSGFKFAFSRNKKGKVFGIRSQLKKLSKYNDVHAQNKTLFSSMQRATIAAENSHNSRWRHCVYSLVGSYVY